MASDLEQLVLSISADTRQIQRALKRLEGDTQSAARKIEGQFSGLGKRINAQFVAMGRSFARTFVGMFATGLTARGMQQLSDAATRIDNALKVAGLSGAELEKVYGRLRESAVRNAAPIESLVELYGRAALVQKELGISGEELLNFTDKIAVALRVSGQSAAESSGALLQLSQALGSGVVRAEEFNSILEGALPIAQAAAAGLKEAGGSVAALRQLVVDGKVSSQAFFRAFEAGAPILEEKVANATFTVSQATGNLGTALIDVAREFNHSTGASERFAGGINNAARAIADFDASGFISKLQEAHGALDRFLDDIANSSIMERFAELVTGADLNIGRPVLVETLQAETEIGDLERQIKILEDRIALNKELAIDTTEAEESLNSLLAKANALRAAVENGGVVNDRSVANVINQMVPFAPLGPLPISAKQVSLADFSTPKKDRKKGSGRKTADDRFAESIQDIRDRTAALKAEQEMLGATFYEQQKRTVALDLEQEALKQVREEARKKGDKDWQNVQLSPAQVKAIDEVSAAYARQADELRNAQEAMDLQRDILKGAFSDFRQAWADGKIDAQEWGDIVINALNKVIDKIENGLIDAIIQANSAGNSGGGLFGGLLSGIGGLFGMQKFPGGMGFANPNVGLFADGTANTGGQRGEPRGVVHGQEAVIPLPNGGKVPVQLSMPQMPRLAAASQNGGSVKVDVGVTVDDSGNLQAYVRNVSLATTKAGIRDYDRGSYGRTLANIQEGRRRNAGI